MDTVENATTTLPAEPVDSCPWDDPDPFTPEPWVPQPNVTLTIAPTLGYRTFVKTDPELGLIAVLHLGDSLALHFTGGQPDEQVLDNIDRLAAALSAMRAVVVIEQLRAVPEQVLS